MTLNELKAGDCARLLSVGGTGTLRQHFLDMGLIPGIEVCLTKFAPMGDPLEIRIDHYELTLRLADAARITVEKIPPIPPEPSGARAARTSETRHPGFGEEGRYHVKADEHPLPDDTLLTFALAGNQNCGKTTLFNQLTGSSQHVGNFPGVTVDRKSGEIKGHPHTEITDLPGIYSMSPYTAEEIVSRKFILDEKPRGIINIIDATNIERNLYLTLQLLTLNIPMVIAVNMMDEMRGNGGSIRINEMEAALGVPVVPISAAKNEGIHELIDHAIHVAHYCEHPGRPDFCSENDHGGAIHRCLHALMHLIEDHAREADIPVRFAATKLAEGDTSVADALHLDENEKEMVEHIVTQMENERGLDRSAAIADMRFNFIRRLVKETVIQPTESREHVRSRRIDRILTGRFTAIPAFLIILLSVFFLTFNVIGAFLQSWLEKGLDMLTGWLDTGLTSLGVDHAIHSLLIDGVAAGVGSVLSFLPVIVTLFFFLSLLEDTGYMARVAFVTDKLLRKIGLSGRSIVPMLIGFGCTVPGVMASRTLPSTRDRKMTVLLTPFMSCSAKLPIYVFLAGTFFPDCAALVTAGLYVLGILIGLLVAVVFKNTLFQGEAVPFVMELPNYRLPGLRNVAQLLWEKAKDFLQKAFTVIFLASIAIWFLQSFTPSFGWAEDNADSLLAVIGGWLVPVLKPLGLADWRISTSLLTGFVAKESVVSSLTVLFASEGALREVLSDSAAVLALLVFCLLYTPCVAAIGAVRRELGVRWALLMVLLQCSLAWVAALGTRTLVLLIVRESVNPWNFVVLGVLAVLIIAALVIARKRRAARCASCTGDCSQCARNHF